jgi:hypothetical protein
MAEKMVRVINRLPQRLPVSFLDEKTKQHVHGFLPSNGSKTIKKSEVSEHLKGMARQGKIEIVEL